MTEQLPEFPKNRSAASATAGPPTELPIHGTTSVVDREADRVSGKVACHQAALGEVQ